MKKLSFALILAIFTIFSFPLHAVTMDGAVYTDIDQFSPVRIEINQTDYFAEAAITPDRIPSFDISPVDFVVTQSYGRLASLDANDLWMKDKGKSGQKPKPGKSGGYWRLE